MLVRQTKNIPLPVRKEIAVNVLSGKTTATKAANDFGTSRKFIAQQKGKAIAAINNVFTIDKPDKNIIGYLPITESSIEQTVLSDMFDCRSGYRGIIKSLQSKMSYDISLGKISDIFQKNAEKAAIINQAEDLSLIKEGALDELHHLGIPTLVGVDVNSLYCFLMSEEASRDADTWAINLLDLADQGFAPDRTFADFAGGIRAGQAEAFNNIPCFGDLYHALDKINEVKRLIKNLYNSKTTKTKEVKEKSLKNLDKDFIDEIMETYKEELFYKYLYETVSTLCDWLHNDIFRVEGYNPETRGMLYDFIVEELTKLAKLHPKYLRSLKVFLMNKKELLLSFVFNMDKEFEKIAKQQKISTQTLWDICQLMRYGYSNSKYQELEKQIREKLKSVYYSVYSSVEEIIKNTTRSSSSVENLNSRIRPYYELRKRMGQSFLELLRFYLNHSVLQGSEHPLRKGKTPVEIKTNQKHPHWLELLGFDRTELKKAA